MALVLLVHRILLGHEELEVLLQLLWEVADDLLRGLVRRIRFEVRARVLPARGSGLDHHWRLSQELVLLVKAVLHLHTLGESW